MSSLPDNSYRPVTRKNYAERAKHWVISLGLVVAVALGGAQTSLAAQSTDTVTPPATVETSINSANGGTTFSVADVAEKATPSVVTIYTYGKAGSTQSQSQAPSTTPGNGSGSSMEQALGAGSGWIFDKEGHVVTNNHVVEGADSFVVEYSDGTKVAATLVGTDSFQDVAVLQLDLKSGETIPAVATVGDSSTMRAGDQIVAIGSPLGEFTNSVSEGIIGGLNRSLATGNGYSLAHLIQHDAPISPGNSGGPLLNLQGQVIGMNVAKVDYQQTGQASATGLGFAIDGNTVKGIAEQIISTSGNVVYPYLGVSSQELQDGTVQVAQVESGSPADTAGIMAGDIITQVDNTPVTTDAPLLNQLIAHKPGDEIKVTINRNGQTQTVTVTLGERPSGV